MRGDVPIDSETLVVTSSISRFADQSLGSTHRGRVHLYAFIGMSVCEGLYLYRVCKKCVNFAYIVGHHICLKKVC